MKDEIIKHIDNPEKLEAMYRENKSAFRNEFDLVYESIQDHKTAQYWNVRLSHDREGLSWGAQKDLIVVFTAIFIAGLIAKIPDILSISEDFFYPRNISLIGLPVLTFYFGRKQELQTKWIAALVSAFFISAVFINLLPADEQSDTLILACLHLPLFLWAVMGVAYVGKNLENHSKRIDYLKFNGELLIMSGLIFAAGGLFTAITLGLFELIDLEIENFYFRHIAIWGLAGTPVLAAHLVKTNPHLVNNISPLIARIFTPIVLVTLAVYLAAILITGKDPYNDREFLLVFNALLIGVMAIILFSFSEVSGKSVNKWMVIMLLALASLTVMLNGIALSAIVFRISEWGITPNRLAVLGADTLIFINLILIASGLFKMLKYKAGAETVERSISLFLPIYVAWAFIVAFIFPFIFSFS